MSRWCSALAARSSPMRSGRMRLSPVLPGSSCTRCPPARPRCSPAGWPWWPTIRCAAWPRARRPSPTWSWSRPWSPRLAAKNSRCASGWPAGPAGAGTCSVVCAGSRLLAAAGLLDGHRATSHWSRLKGLQRSRPQVDWVGGQRYVQDGKITTTAGVTSGVFGALRLVEQLAGTTEAQRVGGEMAYPGWSLDGPTGIPAQRPAPRDLASLLAALAWRRPTLGVGLAEGVGELDI